MSNAPESQSTTPPPVAPKRPRRWATWLVVAWLVFVAVGQFAVWNDKIIPDTHGQSITTMVTVSMGIVTVLLLMSWLLFFPPFRRKLAFPLAALIYLVAVGAVVASIREVHFTGDMRPTVTFRWQPTLED